jgi:hypothetical protein
MWRERPFDSDMDEGLGISRHNGKHCPIVALPPQGRTENHTSLILPVTAGCASHSKASEAQVKGRGSGILHPASSLGG